MFFTDFMFTDYLELLESIEYEDINKRFKEHFTKDNVVLSIINPIKR